MSKNRAQQLSVYIGAYIRCVECGNTEWEKRHAESISRLMDSAPSGSGVDCGIGFDWVESEEQKLIFNTAFHHMNESGVDGWTEHKVVVTPEFNGVYLKIYGRNKNEVKEYLHDIIWDWLTEVPELQEISE